MYVSDLAAIFENRFWAAPHIFSAPGRVNLIGEHTDYNDGFVLPSAIGFYTQAAVASRKDGKLAIASTEFAESFEFEFDNLPPKKLGSWCDYVVGVATVLKAAGVQFNGASLLVHGEVPIGAGLSSSAAVEVATAFALLSLSHRKIPNSEIPKLCQKAENEFVGARVGVMDQFVSCNGKQGHALLLDCRSLDFELVPVPDSVRLIICNTLVKHELSGGEYNQRREECEQGVRILRTKRPSIRALRDVTVQELMANRGGLPDVVFKRCLHVVEENRRTEEAARLLSSGNLTGVGQLMRESHRSLRDLYQVSCRELDIMVEAAEGLSGYYGGRLTGGGFGGCTVNLVDADKAGTFSEEVAARYKAETGIQPQIYVCSAAEGAAQMLQSASKSTQLQDRSI